MWKNLKGLFVVEEENRKSTGSGKRTPPSSPAAPPKANVDAAPPPGPSPSPPLRVSEGGEVDDKFVKVLLQAMEGADLPGFDYLEYKKVLQSLEPMNFEDEVRYRSAYAGAQSMGVSPVQLVDSAQHYLQVLGQEQQKFQTALNNQQQQQIGNKQSQIEKLGKDIADREVKIKKLQEEIVRKRAEMEKTKASISDNVEKLQRTEANFSTTYTTITSQIKQDINRMKQYLQ